LHGYNLNAAARLALALGDRAEAIALLNQGIEEAQEIGDVNLQHTLLVNVVRLYVTNDALDAVQAHPGPRDIAPTRCLAREPSSPARGVS
jgi:hypothetical protein